MSTDLEAMVLRIEANMRRYEKQWDKAYGTTDKRAREIERRAQQMTKKLDSITSGAMRSVAPSLGVLAGAITTGEVLKYADAWKSAQNSLAVAGVTGKAQAQVLDQLYDSAIRNYAPLNALTGLYGQAAMSQQELGASSAELIKFSDGVGVALRVAGKSSTEAAGALQQLGQLLGSSRVQAEEFNSIIDGARPILIAVANGIDAAGGSVSKLKQLVNAGEVSNKQFFDGFLRGLPTIQAMAANSLPTLEQGITNVTTALTRYIGSQDQSLGATAMLSRGLKALADDFDNIADVGLKVAAVIAGALVGRAIGGMITKLGAAGGAVRTFMALLKGGQAASAFAGLAAGAGPLGLVIGTVATGVALLSLRQTEGARIANQYAQYTDEVRRAAEGSATALDAETEAIRRKKLAQNDAAKLKAGVAADQTTADLGATRDAVIGKTVAALPRADQQALGEINRLLKTGAIDAAEYEARLGSLAAQSQKLRAIFDRLQSTDVELNDGTFVSAIENLKRVEFGAKAAGEALAEAGGRAQSDFGAKLQSATDSQARALSALSEQLAGLANQPGFLRGVVDRGDAKRALNDLAQGLAKGERSADDFDKVLAELVQRFPRLKGLADVLTPFVARAREATAEIRRLNDEQERLTKSAARRGPGRVMGEAYKGEAERAAPGGQTTTVDKVASDADAEAAKTEREKAIDKQTEELTKNYAAETGKAADQISDAIKEALRQRATENVDNAAAREVSEGFSSDVVKKYVDQVVKAENSTGNPAAKNPNSSATGDGQFIASTWETLFRKYFQAEAAGMSRQQILDRRSDPDLSRKMIELYAQENAEALKGAGLAVTTANLHLAHFLGSGGAIKALKADPNASARSVLGDKAANANPTIIGGNNTIADVLAYADRRAKTTRIAAKDLTPAEEKAQDAATFEKSRKRDATRNVEDLDADTEALNRQAEAVTRLGEAQAYFDAQAERAKYIREEMRKIEDEGIEKTPEIIAQIESEADAHVAAAQRKFEADKRVDDARKTSRELADAQDWFAEEATSAFTDIITGATTAEQAMRKLLSSLVEAAIQAALLGKGPLAGIFGTAGAGGGTGGLFGAIFGAFGGARAGGGPVQAGKTYLVGEKRPELFVPNQSGRIIPKVPEAPILPRQAGVARAQRVETVVRVEANEYFDARVDSRAQGIATPLATRAGVQSVRTSDKRWAQNQMRYSVHGQV